MENKRRTKRKTAPDNIKKTALESAHIFRISPVKDIFLLALLPESPSYLLW
jgi:hypothetical protein